MTGEIQVFVNARRLDLPAGADVREAIRAFDPALETGLSSGAAFVTDARGLEIDPSSRLASGSILRVAIRARRGDKTPGTSDADP